MNSFTDQFLRLVWGPGTRSRLYNSTGFLFICWAAHYFPFWLMGRQRFLHHYLPAHLASCLVAGALVEFITNLDPIHNTRVQSVAVVNNNDDHDDPSGKSKKKHLAVVTAPRRGHFITAKERMGFHSLVAGWIATLAILAVVAYGFVFFAPLTYGTPGLEVEQVIARRWLNYDLHFAK